MTTPSTKETETRAPVPALSNDRSVSCVDEISGMDIYYHGLHVGNSREPGMLKLWHDIMDKGLGRVTQLRREAMADED